MSYGREEYYQECFEIAMDESGAGEALKMLTDKQRKWIGGAIAGAVENQSLAFYTPDSPLLGENDRLTRKLKWERELEGCRECGGRGRLEYSAGPWWVNTGCDKCNGSGKVHPRGEREPA